VVGGGALGYRRLVTPAFYAKLAFAALASLSAYGFVHAARKDERRSSCSALCALQPAYAGRSLRAPEFELPDLEGRPVRLSSFRGKTVVLNFNEVTTSTNLQVPYPYPPAIDFTR
jgi:cytochrome oxidase Cu insertion factor (SCO1/SenC/PrrC family)